MSKNKGKDGEMRVLITLANIVKTEEDCDVTRHTNTNTADGGADLVLEHPEGLLSYLHRVAAGDENLQSPDLSRAPREKTRIDVKTTDRKLSPDTIVKFAGDIKRNPDCNGHVLMGGSGLSNKAKSDLEEIKTAYEEVGKTVLYISNKGTENLEHHYGLLPDHSDDNKEQT
ncbi:hypothetical protein [Endozoicomonas sp. ALC020]|uniref:hypothetical protein n=1 Tax=unclassified Endozoicomonas TaxID=2644528 RepID=UPI003BAF14E9